ncbi:N-acetylglucosamine-6-phosphate deacetylase [Bacillus sp. IITD106]|nr:N-acetylglucosamine-6-phosphate deacetylase [Bacillus sp. IITD106]
MENKIFKNANIYLPEKIIEDGWMLVDEHGKIKELGEGEREFSNKEKIVDIKGMSIIPGLIDVHIHGGNGYSFMDGSYESLAEISSFHAKHGTTSFLATTSTASKEKIIKALNSAVESFDKGMPGADLVGVHLEGPFINEKRSGAQEKSDIRLSSINEMEEYLKASNHLIKLVTLAPEVENGLEAVKYFSDKGVTVSIGHSDANFQEVLDAIKHGATHTTHHFNGMSPLHHREPGVAGAGLALNELTTEIIADGIHVHPEMIKLLFKIKGVWNTCAITDAVFCAGLPDGEYDRVFLTNGQVYLSDGSTLAGSTLTMIQSLKNVISFTGYSLLDVLPSYTMVPARQAKIDHYKGSIDIGKDADFLIVNDDLTILSTFVKGNEVYKKQ